MDAKLKKYYSRRLDYVNAHLRGILPKRSGYTQKLLDAMHYSLLAGGKRLRPVLVIASAEMFGSSMESVIDAACSVELLHTYSLIHDDLPAMDNDDFRRGKPTSHKKFGEACAILAGDALLTYAFELLAKNARIKNLKSDRFYYLIRCLSEGAGFCGMVGGQAADIEYTGGAGLSLTGKKDILKFIHRNKTAALIRAGLCIGAVLAGAEGTKLRRLESFGEKIGLVFQIVDDILDETKTAEELGKSNSDKVNKKLTYPGVYGLEASVRKAEKLVKQANLELDIFGKRSEYIKLIAEYFVRRSK